MRKRSTFIALSVLVVLALVYALRVPAVDLLARRGLDELGVPVGSLVVERVSLDGLVLKDIALGNNGELQAAGVAIGWDALPPWAPVLQHVHIDRLELNVDLSGDAPAFGSLHNLVAGERQSGTAGAALALPEIRLSNAMVTVRSPTGPYTIELNGSVRTRTGQAAPGPGQRNNAAGAAGGQHAVLDIIATGALGRIVGTLDAELDSLGELRGKFNVGDGALDVLDARLNGLGGVSTFTARNGSLIDAAGALSAQRLELRHQGSGGAEFSDAKLDFKVDQTDVSVVLELLAADQSLAVHVDGRAKNYLAIPSIELQAMVRASADSKIWSMSRIGPLTAGEVTLDLHASGVTQPFERNGLPWPEQLRQSTIKARGKVSSQQVSVASVLDEMDGTLEFDASVGAGTGRLALTKQASFAIKRLHPEWLAVQGLPAWLAEALGEGTRVTLDGNGVEAGHVAWTSEDAGLRISGRLSGEARSATSRLAFSTKADAAVDAAGEVRLFDVRKLTATLESKSIDAPGTGTVQQPVVRLTGALSGAPERWAGQLEIGANARHMSVDEVRISRPSITLPLAIEGGADSWKLRLSRPGSIAQQGLGPFGAVSIRSQQQWSIPELNLTVTNLTVANRADSSVLAHSLAVEPGPISLAVDRPDEPALVVDVKPGKIRLEGKLDAAGYRAACTVTNLNFDMPQFQLSGEGLAAELACADGGKKPLAQFSVKSIVHGAKPALVAPMGLNGRVERTANGLSLNASSQLAGEPRLHLLGRYSPASGAGDIDIKFAQAAFAQGGLQPSDLFPVLAFMQDASGQLGFTGKLGWTGKDTTSAGVLELADLSFSQDGVTVSGLNSTVHLSDLLALTTHSAQRLTVTGIGLGVPLENIEVTYGIETAEQTIVRVDEASVSLLGGTLTVGGMRLGTGRETEAVINVAAIDLEKLLDFVQVDGLTGTGQISGQVPLVLDTSQVSIRAGRLAASGPGTLHFRSAKASELLGGSGKEAQLMLRALEEFRYSELTLALDKTAGHDLNAALSTLGHNPKVLDGRQFRLNINLESNIGKILDAIGEGYRLSNDALRRAFRVR